MEATNTKINIPQSEPGKKGGRFFIENTQICVTTIGTNNGHTLYLLEDTDIIRKSASVIFKIDAATRVAVEEGPGEIVFYFEKGEPGQPLSISFTLSKLFFRNFTKDLVRAARKRQEVDDVFLSIILTEENWEFETTINHRKRMTEGPPQITPLFFEEESELMLEALQLKNFNDAAVLYAKTINRAFRSPGETLRLPAKSQKKIIR